MSNKKIKIIISIDQELNQFIERYQEAYRDLHQTRPPSKATIIENHQHSLSHSIDLKVEELREAKKELDKTKI